MLINNANWPLENKEIFGGKRNSLFCLEKSFFSFNEFKLHLMRKQTYLKNLLWALYPLNQAQNSSELVLYDENDHNIFQNVHPCRTSCINVLWYSITSWYIAGSSVDMQWIFDIILLLSNKMFVRWYSSLGKPEIGTENPWNSYVKCQEKSSK